MVINTRSGLNRKLVLKLIANRKFPVIHKSFIKIEKLKILEDNIKILAKLNLVDIR